MKFLSALAGLAAAYSIDAQEGSMIQLDSKMQLVSAALSMTSTRAEAHALLEEALSTFQGAHSHNRVQEKIAVEGTLDAQSSLVTVPIDEKKALNLKVSPTFQADTVKSVTLKAFRKIVGYDTFESIRKQDRSEVKDSSDYYNVTVSMMVRRKPVEAASAPARDPYAPDGAPALAATLDKGFPYDD